MQLAVTATGFDLRDDLLLLRIQRRDEIGKLAPAPGPGTGDVGGIAVIISPGIDQEGVALRIRHPLGRQMGVMKDGRVAVDGDDIAIGRLIGPLPDRLHVGQVDLELARPRHEGVLGRDVAAHPEPIRRPQTLQLIGRLVGTVVV